MTESGAATHIPLEGALNLRDVGGYRTPRGSVATGVVFRSDNLAELTDADLATFDRLGIKSVYDFRGDREVELQPSRYWSSVEHRIRVPISEDRVQEKSFIEIAIEYCKRHPRWRLGLQTHKLVGGFQILCGEK